MAIYGGAPTVGYQTSERSGATVQVYNRPGGVLQLASRVAGYDSRRIEDGDPQLLSVQCSNALNSGGRFSFSLHVPPGVDVFSLIEIDAWCDISFYRFKTSWHIMRGMVDEVRVRRDVTGSGVTTITANVTGRSFQKAWETTPCWFNELSGNTFTDEIIFKATGSGQIASTPPINIRSILFKFMDLVGTTGRANWQLPAAMPGPGGSVTTCVQYDTSLFDKTRLKRATIRGDLFFPDVKLWALATQHYAESQFCELFTDILPVGGTPALAQHPKQESGISASNSRMTLILRDKPFPLADPLTKGTLGLSGTYFKLPSWTVPPQAVRSIDLGKSSYEAFNSFMSVNNFDPESAASFGTLKAPLWSVNDMLRRGMRRLDTDSPYMAFAPTTDLELMQARRARSRDWYCLGAELGQGSVQFWRLHPEIHIGGRLRVAGATPDNNTTGYVESVRHQWSPQGGAVTAVDWTRVWQGTDRDLVARLGVVSRGYTLVPPSRA